MIITVKTSQKFLAAIGLAVFIFSSSLAWSGISAFTDWSLNELNVVEVNPEAETVSLESPDGNTAVLALGDIVGKEGATIIEIRKLMIILEVPPDDFGRRSKRYIPVIRIGYSESLKAQ